MSRIGTLAWSGWQILHLEHGSLRLKIIPYGFHDRKWNATTEHLILLKFLRC